MYPWHGVARASHQRGNYLPYLEVCLPCQEVPKLSRDSGIAWLLGTFTPPLKIRRARNGRRQLPLSPWDLPCACAIPPGAQAYVLARAAQASEYSETGPIPALAGCAPARTRDPFVASVSCPLKVQLSGRHFAHFMKHFLEEARSRLSPANSAADLPHRVGRFICEPLETFVPEDGRYDLIWIQWVLGHLHDADFVAFFQRCIRGLKPGGFIMVKENNCKEGFVVDKEDSSLTRSDKYLQSLFVQAGLRVCQVKRQQEFPQELFAVRMYALQPIA
ncbi:hypothetical protein CYMTET_42828 [Cymbomonas tetramitiformis]|uniref:Alpha N-terminal protein methyltransferase 1 n=1 Tax=Cymbomonas tetramitiformis TaxID=36881 RepID=A0AAE0F294_9CHLO|nr:hypothetical protein CYMTET_42828 [Cymbomonas tetramitiformis]